MVKNDRDRQTVDIAGIPVDPTNLLEAKRLHQFLRADSHVRELAHITTQTNLGIGVTVLVGGIMISGVTIGYETYIEAALKTLDSQFENSTDVNAKKIVRQICDAERTTEAGADVGIADDFAFLHLSNVCFLNAPRQLPDIPDVVVRIRIDSIDAFIMGGFSIEMPAAK